MLFLAACPAAIAAETNPLQSLLQRPIVGPVLPLAEVQRYCEARVPRMADVKTAAQWEAEARPAAGGRARKGRLSRRGRRVARRAGQGRVARHHPRRARLPHQEVRYEALPGLWIPALLYEPEKLAGKVPVIMNVNGHVGATGKADPYKQIRCINQAKRGMLALNVEWIGMGQLGGAGFGHARMNQLDLCGTSGLAPFYLSMKRGLDLLLGLDQRRSRARGGHRPVRRRLADDLHQRAGHPRDAQQARGRLLQFPHPGRCTSDLGDSEQTPCDLATVADYTHLTAMRAPRPTLLTNNSKDNCCFASGYALPPLLDAAGPIFGFTASEDALRSHVNDDPGTHNYELDNRQAFYRMLGDFFYPGR